MNIFEKVFRELNKAKVDYLVVGGVAVNLYGYVRFTGDLDLLVLLDEKNIQKMDRVMKKLGYYPRLPVSVHELSNRKQVQKWFKEKNLRAFTFMPPRDNPLEIDIIIEESLKFAIIAKDKTIKHIEKVRIPIVSIEQLLKMKRKAGRPNDIQDIKALLELKKL